MLDEVKKRAQDQANQKLAEHTKKASAYHRAFVQNEAGKEVLANWVRQYCMTPLNGSSVTLFDAGVAEGKRQIVKEILDHIAFITQER